MQSGQGSCFKISVGGGGSGSSPLRLPVLFIFCLFSFRYLAAFGTLFSLVEPFNYI
jgi:hypothetical protein